jgi:colanic acid/amylovoran biosynthesis glycosyltransferase
MLGAGFACVYARSFRRNPPGLDPRGLERRPGDGGVAPLADERHRFTAGAHAYDVFEHGGDWWLTEKLEAAAFVHTSTELARDALVGRGVRADKVVCIRSGLDRLPAMKPRPRLPRPPACPLAGARLVEKKGLDRQLRIYAALKAAGVEFRARIVGDGPLRQKLEKLAGHLGVADQVTFTGQVPSQEVWEHLAGPTSSSTRASSRPSGDRDGLPNVIAEAMAAGVPVVTSPTAGTTEAVKDGVTGVVLPVDRPEAWVAA